MTNEKCDTCRLRYVCEEQAEWICKHRNYCDYSPENMTNNHIADDGKKVQLIDILPLMKNGWHLVRTGESNRFLASMSLADVPTVDAVEVVRCKDCKHGIWDEEEQMWECVLAVDLTGDLDTYSMFHEYNDGEHFCSYGERKDDAKEIH